MTFPVCLSADIGVENRSILPAVNQMPAVTPQDKVFFVSQYYAGKTVTQIQRKFERDHKQIFSKATIARWFKRVPEQFEKECHMKRKVRRAG